MPVKKIDYPAAVLPPAWEKEDASALQALERGTATPEQQQRAISWILYHACGAYDNSYRPDPYEHAAVSGKRMVGLNIITLLKVKLGNLPNKH